MAHESGELAEVRWVSLAEAEALMGETSGTFANIWHWVLGGQTRGGCGSPASG